MLVQNFDTFMSNFNCTVLHFHFSKVSKHLGFFFYTIIRIFSLLSFKNTNYHALCLSTSIIEMKDGSKWMLGILNLVEVMYLSPT